MHLLTIDCNDIAVNAANFAAYDNNKKNKVMKKFENFICKVKANLGVISIYLIGMTVVALQLRSLL